ncbi:HWE histidine kinase domain-containing protein [Paracoccus shanxieyensis]|uniref:histidine kinase n=1 Tax=Paracoccus shanxieyensis TaxID=2675752 RepID=A0A6L6J065_9RHOB|nr:PAS domain-containing protein [Paracoccus shanxieyensis]
MTSDAAAPFAFLGHDGAVAGLIRDFDWSQTALGRVETWPQCLKTATALLLHSPVPIVMLWGERGVMIYNDAYSVFAGHRHPQILGSNVREGWREVADFNDHVMRVGLAGGTLAYRDQELTLYRKGYPEQVWMNLDYSPVADEQGKPAGVIAIVVETTERVLAERRNRQEFQRLQSMFSQAPTFMAMLSGADHRFELMNPEYRRLIGGRDVIGQRVDVALPEVARQGYVLLLDHVFSTGETVKRMSEPVFLNRSPDAPLEQRFLDFVYQPIRDDSGAVTHIFVQGSDVTERVRAESHQRFLINELNHRVKNTLASIQSIVGQTLRGASSKDEALRSINARILALSRAHDVLTQENWDGADLRSIIDSATSAFRDRGDAFRIDGPDLRLGPRAALAVALAVHELGTNASQHGALSAPEGQVSIRWRVDDRDIFRLEWAETGGPPVTPASRTGFGSRLILEVLPQELQGAAHIDHRPTGTVFVLESPVAAVSDKPLYRGEADGTHSDR